MVAFLLAAALSMVAVAEYPLAIEQHRGITLDRVKQIAAGAGHL